MCPRIEDLRSRRDAYERLLEHALNGRMGAMRAPEVAAIRRRIDDLDTAIALSQQADPRRCRH